MLHRNNRSHQSVFIAIACGVLALVLRVPYMELMEFKSDEAYSVLAVVNFFDQPHIITQGLKSSVGAYNFPMFHYLLILIGLLSTNPVVMAQIIAVINSASVGLFFYLADRHFPRNIALVSGLLLATTPWSVILSRKIWAQDLILPFAVVISFLFFKQLKKPQAQRLAWLLGLLSLLTQLHASGLFLAVTLMGILIFQQKLKPIQLKLILIAVSLSLIPALPYFYTQITSNPICPACQAIQTHQQQTDFNLEHLLIPFQITTVTNFKSLFGSNYTQLTNNLPFGGITSQILQIITIGLVGLSIYSFSKKRKLLLVFSLLLSSLYLLVKTPVVISYYAIALPMMLLLISRELHFLFKNKFGLYLIVGIWFGSNLLWIQAFYQTLKTNSELSGTYGPTYQLSKTWIQPAIEPYQSRADFEQIKLWAQAQPEPHQVHFQLARYFESGNEFDLAIDELHKIIDFYPEHSFVVHLMLYKLYQQNNQETLAQENLEQAQNLAGSDKNMLQMINNLMKE